MIRNTTAAAIVAMALLATPAFAQSCPTSPAPVHDLTLVRYQADNIKARTEHEAAVRPLIQLTEQLARLSDRAVDGDQIAAKCIGQVLVRWADGEAYLGNFTTKQAIAQRNWDLSAIAIAFLKARPLLDEASTATIEAWLRQVADVVANDYKDDKERKDSQYYWMGAGNALVAVATDSTEHWAVAKTVFDHAMTQVDSNNMLPLELERGSRALFYHAHAANALVLIAEVADTLGYDFYKPELHLLIATINKALQSNKPIFASLTGAKQDTTGMRPGWLQLYTKRYPSKLKGPFKDIGDGHRSIGGSVKGLASMIAYVKKDQARDDNVIDVPDDRPLPSVATKPAPSKQPCRCDDQPTEAQPAAKSETPKDTGAKPSTLRRRPL